MTSVAAIAQSGMTAATVRLNSSASNLANARDTSRIGVAGYRPTKVQDTALPGGGVAASAVTMKPGTMLIYDPTSSLANVPGFLNAPEIDPISEVSNLLVAGHAFAFSVKVLKAADDDEKTLLDLKT